MHPHDNEPSGHSPRSGAEERKEPTGANAVFNRATWALFAAGVFAMAAGYALLAMAGRQGVGAAGRWSPMLIVGGLVVFGLGFAPRQ
ncbi:MAG: hypothetical protein NTW86_27315 [Candidatus Sumerlaeota bacterium]|nr:hypothetical protein [Candidatus Sumerlaeota bacterium]